MLLMYVTLKAEKYHSFEHLNVDLVLLVRCVFFL